MFSAESETGPPFPWGYWTISEDTVISGVGVTLPACGRPRGHRVRRSHPGPLCAARTVEASDQRTAVQPRQLLPRGPDPAGPREARWSSFRPLKKWARGPGGHVSEDPWGPAQERGGHPLLSRVTTRTSHCPPEPRAASPAGGAANSSCSSPSKRFQTSDLQPASGPAQDPEIWLRRDESPPSRVPRQKDSSQTWPQFLCREKGHIQGSFENGLCRDICPQRRFAKTKYYTAHEARVRLTEGCLHRLATGAQHVCGH